MLIVLKSPFHFLLNEKINFNAFFIVKILFTKNRLKIPILGIILKEKVIFGVEKIFFSTQNVIDSDRYWWDLSKTVFGISKFPLDRKICTKNRLKIPILGDILKENVIFKVEKYFFQLKTL